MNFIFMLTRQDQTISDCLSVIALIEPVELAHIGFKDIGVPSDVLRKLHARIKDTGATSYLEVVSTTKQEALASARVAAEIGVDCLLGGTWVSETLSLLQGLPIKYFPFVGQPHGHPTRLDGTPELVAEQCRQAEQLGCAGVDLLAYRADQAQPIDLIRAAPSALHGQLIVAGSVERAEQIIELQEAGADAFTIGSAAFSGRIEPRAGLLATQLETVMSLSLDPSRARAVTHTKTTNPMISGQDRHDSLGWGTVEVGVMADQARKGLGPHPSHPSVPGTPPSKTCFCITARRR